VFSVLLVESGLSTGACVIVAAALTFAATTLHQNMNTFHQRAERYAKTAPAVVLYLQVACMLTHLSVPV
jgi:uncharacterized membrane protein YidH (DUF202 family)